MSTPEIVQDPPPIDAWPDGSLRVSGRRVKIEWVISMYRDERAGAETIARELGLPEGDVHGIIAYYLRHRAEMDRYVADQFAANRAFMDEHRRLHPQEEFAAGIRERAAKMRATDPD